MFGALSTLVMTVAALFHIVDIEEPSTAIVFHFRRANDDAQGRCDTSHFNIAMPNASYQVGGDDIILADGSAFPRFGAYRRLYENVMYQAANAYVRRANDNATSLWAQNKWSERFSCQAELAGPSDALAPHRDQHVAIMPLIAAGAHAPVFDLLVSQPGTSPGVCDVGDLDLSIVVSNGRVQVGLPDVDDANSTHTLKCVYQHVDDSMGYAQCAYRCTTHVSATAADINAVCRSISTLYIGMRDVRVLYSLNLASAQIPSVYLADSTSSN